MFQFHLMPAGRENTLSRSRYYRKVAVIAIATILALLVPALSLEAPAYAESTAGPVHVTYVYSPLCTLCEHAGPVVREAVTDLKSSGVDIEYEECSFQSREGMGYMARFGVDSVPAVIIGDRAIRAEDYNGDTARLGSLLRRDIAEAARHTRPIVLERKVSRDQEKDTLNVVTCVTNRGDEPVFTRVRGGLCDGVRVVAGDASWQGTLMPGDRHFITYEADVSGSVTTLPAQTLTYTDSRGEHRALGPETPVYLLKKLSPVAVFLAGVVAGINPCLLAVLAFVSAMALSMRGRRLYIVLNLLAFCAGLLSIYVFLGIGFLRLVERIPAATAILKAGIVLLLFALALFAFHEAYQVRKDADRPSLFKSFLGRLKPLYRRFGLAANFGLGGAFGLIKMPCVGGVYIAILGAIVEAGEVRSGLFYLAAYNLGVVLPVLALGGLLALGLSPGKVDDFRKRYRFHLKIATGLILAAMAAGFILNLI